MRVTEVRLTTIVSAKLRRKAQSLTYALVRDVSRLIEEVEDYCFPKHKRSLCDVLDGLAAYILDIPREQCRHSYLKQRQLSAICKRGQICIERYGK